MCAFAETVSFLRSFGPSWQCAVARGHFADGSATARVKKDYQARGVGAMKCTFEASEKNDLSFRKGDIIEVGAEGGKGLA